MKRNVLSINKNNDFRRLYRVGKSYVHSCVVVYAAKNRLKLNRVGITATKKVGNAVQRNRARRVIRAAYYQIEPQLKKGYDFIFVSRVKTTQVKSTEVLAAMEKLLGDFKI